jgi:hypothetical protein
MWWRESVGRAGECRLLTFGVSEGGGVRHVVGIRVQCGGVFVSFH